MLIQMDVRPNDFGLPKYANLLCTLCLYFGDVCTRNVPDSEVLLVYLLKVL